MEGRKASTSEKAESKKRPRPPDGEGSKKQTKPQQKRKDELLFQIARRRFDEYTAKQEAKRAAAAAAGAGTSGGQPLAPSLGVLPGQLASTFRFFQTPRPWDRSIMYTPDYQQQWKQPVSVTLPIEIGSFIRMPGGAGHLAPARDPLPQLVAVDKLVGENLAAGYDSAAAAARERGEEAVREKGTVTELLGALSWFKFYPEQAQANFVTYRSNLNKIMCMPYTKARVEIKVTRRRGVIYLDSVTVQPRQDERTREAGFCGRRFDALCCGEGHVPDAERPERCRLLRTKLGNKHHIVFGAESKARQPTKDGGGGSENVELKTMAVLHGHGDRWAWERHKLLRWWCQSFLAGIPEIVVAVHDAQHRIVRVERHRTLGIPGAVDKERQWDSELCLNFTDKLLSFLQESVAEGAIYKLSFDDPWEQVALTLDQSP